MERNLTCIVCPLGCEITVFTDENGNIGIQGNTCPRGKPYAIDECTNPKRVVTTTMECTDGSLVAVKTDIAIPKEKMIECMKIINQTIAKLPISVGDIIIENVFGSNIVATQNKN